MKLYVDVTKEENNAIFGFAATKETMQLSLPILFSKNKIYNLNRIKEENNQPFHIIFRFCQFVVVADYNLLTDGLCT